MKNRLCNSKLEREEKKLKKKLSDKTREAFYQCVCVQNIKLDNEGDDNKIESSSVGKVFLSLVFPPQIIHKNSGDILKEKK